MAAPTDLPRAVAGRARQALARSRAGVTEARRSLPIARPSGEIRALWADPASRAAVLDGLPSGDAAVSTGADARGWGTVYTVHLRFDAPLPGPVARAEAGKVVRRLKSLAETGEIPTTARNPSARPDAGEEAT
jgi:hypothetical protein